MFCMDSEFTLELSSPLGHLKLEFQDNRLSSLQIIEVPTILEKLSVATVKNIPSISDKIRRLLNQYFSSAIAFTALPLLPQGTAFQCSVWKALTEIPLGETRTYGDIAKQLNSSPRAVGNACRKNPIQIIVPCHRVVSANNLGGYAGKTDGGQLEIKRWLLNHEGVAL